MQTTSLPGFTPIASSAKEWAWSYSKLKNFETCPRRHKAIDLDKKFKEEESDELLWGNQVHKALADYIGKDKPLPDKFKDALQPYADMGKRISGTRFVEQQYAIRKDFSKTTYFAKDVWFRGIADVVGVRGPVAIVLDWKTGKIVEDSVQLTLTAACIFAHFPEVRAVRTEFVWIKHGATTRVDVQRSGMPAFWAGVLPRVHVMKLAADSNNYPAKPSGLCRRHCVVTSCEHCGE